MICHLLTRFGVIGGIVLHAMRYFTHHTQMPLAVIVASANQINQIRLISWAS